MTNKPVYKVRIKGLNGAVWANDGKEGLPPMYSVTVERTYKVGEEWKSTTSMRPQDIPIVQEVYRQCLLFIWEGGHSTADEA